MKPLAFLSLSLTLLSCSSREPASPPEHARKAPDESHDGKHIEESNVVELSAQAQQRAGIVVQPARLAAVEAFVHATGTVQPIDSRVAQVRPLSRGRVLQVLVNVGDRVVKDQPLARFDNIEAGELSSQIDAAKADLQRARIQLANAQRQAQRARNLLEVGAIPAKELESAEADAKALEEGVRSQQSLLAGLETRLKRFGSPVNGDASYTSIRAPFAGVVIRSEAAQGDVVDSATAIFSIADLSRVYVEAQVYEKDLGRIRIGQTANITVDSYQGQAFAGRVAAIRDILNPQTRTAIVRCELDNPGFKLKLEMFANVSFPTTQSHMALSVPSDAVQTIQRRMVVFVRKADLHFEAREVQVLGDGPMLEVVAGLREGEPIVVKGAFQLKSAFLARELESEHGHD